MILSERHKFIFVKGRKVGGTSIEVLLADICGPSDIITPITPIDEKDRLKSCRYAAQNYGVEPGVNDDYLESLRDSSGDELASIKLPRGTYYHHMPLKEILSHYGDVPTDWLIFAFERNPYHKIISYANMMLEYGNYLKTGTKMISCVSRIKDQVNKLFENNQIKDVLNIDLYKDKEGNLPTVVFRYEEIDSEIKRVMEKLNIRSFPELGHYKRGMGSENLNPLLVFTSQQLEQINSLFEEEFSRFEYRMLGCPC